MGQEGMTMCQAPMMPLWTDALIGDTMHLSAGEFGSYLLLLIATWRNNGVPFADDDKQMARRCRVSMKVWRSMRPTLVAFYDLSEGTWRQKRLEAEWQKSATMRSLQRTKSVLGNEAKKLKSLNSGLPVGFPVGSLTNLQSPEEERKNHTAQESESTAARDHLKVVHDADNPADNSPAEPPVPRSARRALGPYRFEGKVIRLNPADFEGWQTAFYAIPDLAAELWGLDAWYADRPEKQKGWFNATPGMLARKHNEILLAEKQAKREEAEEAELLQRRKGAGMW